MIIENDSLTKIYGKKVGCSEICLSVDGGANLRFSRS